MSLEPLLERLSLRFALQGPCPLMWWCDMHPSCQQPACGVTQPCSSLLQIQGGRGAPGAGALHSRGGGQRQVSAGAQSSRYCSHLQSWQPQCSGAALVCTTLVHWHSAARAAKGSASSCCHFHPGPPPPAAILRMAATCTSLCLRDGGASSLPKARLLCCPAGSSPLHSPGCPTQSPALRQWSPQQTLRAAAAATAADNYQIAMVRCQYTGQRCGNLPRLLLLLPLLLAAATVPDAAARAASAAAQSCPLTISTRCNILSFPARSGAPHHALAVALRA